MGLLRRSFLFLNKYELTTMITVKKSEYNKAKLRKLFKEASQQYIQITDEEAQELGLIEQTPTGPTGEPEPETPTGNTEPQGPIGEEIFIMPEEVIYDNVIFTIINIDGNSDFDFDVNNIKYKIISLEDKTVSITSISSLYNRHIKLNKYVNTDVNVYGYISVEIDENNPYLTVINNALYSKDLTRLICVFNNIKEYIMPNDVLYVNDNAFPNNIEKIIFNDNVENLPYLGPPEKLQFLKLSNKIKNINCKSFSFAYNFPEYFSLTELILPRDLETLNPKREQYYDYLPSTLEKITIYNSNIINYKYLYTNDYIFNNLINLKELYVLDTNPTVSNKTIFSEWQYFKLKVYVPKGCKSIYENIEGWNKFYNIIELDE